MQAWMLEYLVCPACRVGGLAVERREQVAVLDGDGESEELLVTGVLLCSHCSARYPVVDEAPRLLPREQLTPDEDDVLQRRSDRTTSSSALRYSRDELDAMLRESILEDYGRPQKGPALRRALNAFDYQRSYADRRVYQLRMLHDLVPTTPSVILDVGGGIGGNLRAAGRVFPLQRGIVADLSPHRPPFFQTGDRRVAYVRADATRLPFRSGSFELVISSFLLEHVAAWTDVVDEVVRVGGTAFVSFGPNVRFPFEIGHVDAPLAHCLPAPVGTSAAYVWGHLTNNRRPYVRIAAILRDMNYISSSRYYAYCRQKGYPCSNLFPTVIQARARSARSGVPGWLNRHPSLARFLVRSLVALGAEPNIYSLIMSTADQESETPRET
jgi:uncharacterized protein YbaR (Trm112 family)